MNHSDDEFDDFLKRRKPLFRDRPDHLFEPPEEVDRIVLRQAHEAIKGDTPQRVYHGPRWGAPLALAATVVLAFSIIMNVERPGAVPQAEVAVQKIARRLDYPAPTHSAARAPAPVAPAANYQQQADGSASGPVMVELDAAGVERQHADPQFAASPPAPQPRATAAPAEVPPSAPLQARETEAKASRLADSVRAGVESGAAKTARAESHARRTEATEDKPEQFPWRSTPRAWLQEIERLHASGEIAAAERERAEFHLRHPTFGTAADAPDR